jgi:hypothetical protein
LRIGHKFQFSHKPLLQIFIHEGFIVNCAADQDYPGKCSKVASINTQIPMFPKKTSPANQYSTRHMQ